jgi:transposase
MDPWELTDDEWRAFGRFLEPTGRERPRRGRPRLDNTRAAAEACLFRHFKRLSGTYHCFGWNELPADFGISPATANRRFREWADSGAWAAFWAALQESRRGPGSPPPCPGPLRAPTPFPVSDLLAELERAYQFLNPVLFGGVLPAEVALTAYRPTRRERKLGYFCGRSWHWGRDQPVDLIAVSARAVERGAYPALGTLIHEMVHLRNSRCGPVDCTGHGSYHNRFFRDVATSVAGLACGPRDRAYGYGFTSLGARAWEAIDRLQPDESLFRRGGTGAEADGSSGGADHPGELGAG